MFQYHYSITYLYDGQEDFLFIPSSKSLSKDEIINFTLGARDRSLFKPVEIWELNHDKNNELIPYSFKEKLL